MNYVTPDFPRRIEIELASRCNLRCTYCPRRFIDNLKGAMSYELFEKIINEIDTASDVILTLHRRGESLLNPDINRIMKLVGSKGFKEVQMATNATLLTPDKYDSLVAGLTFLSFSLDTPEEFNQTRIPAIYTQVETNIIKFLEFNKGRIKTQASMVKTSETTEERCELFMSIWQNRVDRVRIYEEHSSDGNFGSLSQGRGNRKPCFMPIYEMLIYDDGKVGRCNHDWYGTPLGDLTVQTIREVWHSDKYVDLRKQHINLQFTDPVCSKCDSWYPEMGIQGTGQVIEKR